MVSCFARREYVLQIVSGDTAIRRLACENVGCRGYSFCFGLLCARVWLVV